MKKSLILGVTGQDGYYLANLLLGKGYEVFGTTGVELSISPDVRTLQKAGVRIFVADMRDRLALETTFSQAWPDEVYNLAAQPFPPMGQSNPTETLAINTGGPALLFEIIGRMKPDTRFFQASTSEMYGNFSGVCDESTTHRPNSLYGVSKLAAHVMCAMQRDMGRYAVSGILFNHESPRRAGNIVTQKIARAVAAWSLGQEVVLELGALEARRDWGYAPDYIQAMYLMLNQDIENKPPADYVIGSGSSHSVDEFITGCCWGAGISSVPRHLIRRNEKFVRPNDTTRNLVSNPARAIQELGWKPSSSFADLCSVMVVAQIGRLKKAGETPHGQDSVQRAVDAR